MMTTDNDREDRRQSMAMATPLGRPGSGRLRYAAAMHFHVRGKMDETMLEAYRICAKDDREDPRLVHRQLLSRAAP